jgi:hypothetical protein
MQRNCVLINNHKGILLYSASCYVYQDVPKNDVNIQRIEEFKNSFRKYHTVCPKKPSSFFGTTVY